MQYQGECNESAAGDGHFQQANSQESEPRLPWTPTELCCHLLAMLISSNGYMGPEHDFLLENILGKLGVS